MRCIEAGRAVVLLAVLAASLSACDGRKTVVHDAAAPAAVASAAAAVDASVAASMEFATAGAPVASSANQASSAAAGSASPPAATHAASASVHATARAAAGRPLLPPPRAPADADDLRLQFAQRLVAAHPGSTYLTPAPDRLLAIPVLEVELNADGSVRHITVLRKPTTGHEGDAATLLAIAAVRRAAPYGNLSALPKPWKVVETFLFDDSLHFKPRSLDL